uniref:STIL centriolar assembly protein n=1 Tax=Salvator merianae TaxID=96440 RepID=A0A8D0DXW0_SALMN
MDLTSLAAQSQRGILGKMVPLSFPQSKYALWNPAPIGESTLCHLSCYRNPKLVMSEKTLRLTHRHAKQSKRNPFSCFLVGTLSVDEDGGILITVDRFDPGREVTGGLGKTPTAPLPGDFLIPCTVSAWGISSGDIIVHNSDDFRLAFKILQQNLNSQDSLDPSKLLTLRVHICSTEDMDNLNFDFHWAAVTVANTLKCTPVKSVPIIPTALARNLSSPMSIAQVQGTYKFGYLTMDQTRKLLLVLESDPKAYTLPLIGIWLSGISHIYSPQVWTCSLRYLFSSSVQERVFSESGSFLIVLYSRITKDPEFYECLPCSGYTELSFQLFTSKEALHLFQNVESSDKCLLQFELSSENSNSEMELFSKVSKRNFSTSLPQDSSPSKLSVSDHDSGVEDDTSPRPFPRPYPVSQQITEIQPSVPELSIVFDGTSAGSVPTSKHAMMVKQNQLSFGHQPAKMKCSVGHSPYQLSSSDSERQTFGSCAQEPYPKQLPSQLKQRIPDLKHSRRKQPPLQHQTNYGVIDSPARKSFDSCSASPSAPCAGPFVNTTSLQPGTSPERLLTNDDIKQRKEELPFTGPSVSKSQQPSVHSCVPWHTCPLSPPRVGKSVEVQIPVQGPPCCSPCVCNCRIHGHVQCSPTNVWQMCSTHTPEIQSNSAPESTQVMFHQNIECMNAACNPLCVSSSPLNPSHHGIMGNCPACSDNASPAVKTSSPTDPSNAQSHVIHSTCVHTPMPKMGSDNEMMGLSSDVYRILAEQNKQLKLLQAQIQRLLEAQTCSSRTIENGIQSEKQLEFVAMETQSSPGLHMKKSVSIAVSTGASLFWNAPSERSKESVKEHDTEISNEDFHISMNMEKDRSQTSIASSLKAVDIPSFVDSIHVVEEGPSQAASRLGEPVISEVASTSLVNESVNMCLQSRASEGAGNHFVTRSGQNSEHIIPSQSHAPSENQKFYQDILGQVNHFLKESSEENSSKKEDLIIRECTSSSNKEKIEKRSVPDPVLRNRDTVLSATLKQLRNLGVNLDSPSKMMNNSHKVENASILACINPEAVVSGLNYISFANVGMSGLSPNGVDLSMEANAIALKYLSESQLSKLSRSHLGQKNSMASSVQTLLHPNTDKTLVGFGLISPANMSFATKKYMRRYGLLQSSDSSDDDDNDDEQDVNRKEDLKPVFQLDLNTVLEGFASLKDSSERACERSPVNLVHHETEFSNGQLSSPRGPLLQNVTNAVLPLGILHQSNESPRPFVKDLKPKMKLLPGKTEMIQQSEKENLDVHIVSEAPQTSTVDRANQADNMNSVGTFLDVQQLRQLPKLF